MKTSYSPITKALRIGALAGAVGGLAEISWIVIYGTATGAPVEPVARGVTASILPAIAATSGAAWLGLLIHFGLAIALGLALALALRPFSSRRVGAAHFELGVVMLALAAVWAVNFLIALPRINPEFVGLLPYSVTLLSKLLFGLSAGAVFSADRMSRARSVGR